jgi:hypothetical protein
MRKELHSFYNPRQILLEYAAEIKLGWTDQAGNFGRRRNA